MKNFRGIMGTLANVDLFEQVVTHPIASAPPCYPRRSPVIALAGERWGEIRSGGADEIRYRAKSVDVPLQAELPIADETTNSNWSRSWVACKINSPEVRRGLDKFKRDKIVAVIVTDESSNAANCVLIGLKVGNHKLLESDDVGCEADQSACPADVRCGSWLGKGRVR